MSLEIKRERFLDWIQETAEAEEKTELRQRIADLERENEFLQEFTEEPNADSAEVEREEFEKDMMLTGEAEVLSEMFVEEEICEESNDDAELSDPERSPEEAAEPVEAEEELADSPPT